MTERVTQSSSSFLHPVKPVAPKIRSVFCAKSVSFKSVVIFSFLFAAIFCTPAHAMVFINEVYFNPTESDSLNEFIELMGTPGMKLDGYAIAILN